MKPFYQDIHNTLYNMDFRDNDLPDESVQCVVTSPPYWGLRKYSGEQDLIWGDQDCEHRWEASEPSGQKEGGLSYGTKAQEGYTHGFRSSERYLGHKADATYGSTSFCSLCGAWRGGYGLEPTPEMYVQHTIEILREIRRVLRKDGVVFWNIGDSYFSGVTNSQGGPSEKQASNVGSWFEPQKVTSNTLKPKDLCLIPFRVAIAAQEDGWWVRSDIIWSKPNPMPESVTDRPTNSHEYILMLTKSARYYWDADAVREPHKSTFEEFERAAITPREKRNKYATGYEGEVISGGADKHFVNQQHPLGRNLRSVWSFPTQPYPEAHFAVFPEKLPEICIKAASKEGDVVLDPFAGAGTTLWVAKKLNRRAVGYELSEEYCALAVERMRQQILL